MSIITLSIYLFTYIDGFAINYPSKKWGILQNSNSYYEQIKKECWHEWCINLVEYMKRKKIKRAENWTCPSKFQLYEINGSKKYTTNTPILMCIPKIRLVSSVNSSKKDLGNKFLLEQDDNLTQITREGKVVRTWFHEPDYSMPMYINKWGVTCPEVTERQQENDAYVSDDDLWNDTKLTDKKHCIRKALNEYILSIIPVKNNPNFYNISENYRSHFNLYLVDMRSWEVIDFWEIPEIEDIIENKKYIAIKVPYWNINSDLNDKIQIFDKNFKSLITSWPTWSDKIKNTFEDRFSKENIYKINSMNFTGKLLQIHAQPFNFSIRDWLWDFEKESLYTLNLQ